ncbi:hypothetical protein CIL03_07945 [Virgibacillus indicus]|uniref:Gfo/Idh/MocA-like oxidoreductase N-terminal domain-containing protein n=1 Tax=Virgibacillus indicus TaxID=2024554 RepID=A0A265NBW2_9BACI|nr:Gfo/Idh/MocA family oxidoreductase [Virgibacillus indicus]OZU88944.1 hypothetical protein CIL03_07945 [Virgibacillus indicus]
MRVGVIGTGNMGENHVRTYLSIQDRCQLIGIYDNDEEKRQSIAKKYNVKQFQSVDELLKSVDAVSIAVPTEFHYEIGIKCIQHKVHMLMEKPITSTVIQAKKLISKARNAGVILQVGHIELFNPLIQLLTKEIENENIIGVAFHRMSPYDERMQNVDVVKDLMIHDIYILYELLEDDIVELYGLGKTIDGTTKHAVVITKSALGVTAQLTASFKSKRKIRKIQILTEEALIETDILNREVEITQSMIEDSTKAKVPVRQTIQIDDSVQPLRVQLLDFINCIQHGIAPSVSGEDGLKVLMTIKKINDLINKNI